MTDFVNRILRPQQDDFCVRSLLDVDFYKLTMGYFIFENYRGQNVRFELINRNKHIPLARVIPLEELQQHLDYAKNLRLRRTDLYYLRGMDVYGDRMFSEDYLSFLRDLRLPDYKLSIEGDQYRLAFEGPWEVVTFWETIALAIISELYYRNLMRKMTARDLDIMYGRAKDKLYSKLREIKRYPGVRFADFGQRRRHSFLWQQYAVAMARDVLGSQFTGTSNTWMAFNQDLIPIGTNAHELPMVVTALRMADAKNTVRDSDAVEFARIVQSGQYEIIKMWEKLYGQGLRIVLPDTYGSDQFFRNMPEDLAADVASNWRGQRQDSGDPSMEGRKFIRWLREKGVTDPKAAGKTIIFSDGLDVGPMLRLYEEFGDQINVAFGWGTKFTNDFKGCHPNEEDFVPGFEKDSLSWADLFIPFSVVCKVTQVNGQPAVKLSNNPGKATGPQDEVNKYLQIFGEQGRVNMAVEV